MKELTEQEIVRRNKLEDFKPRGATYGDQIQELRVINADLRNYKDGAIEVFEVKELDDYLVNTEDDKDVKISEVKNDESEQKNKEDEQNKLYASLFG